MRVVNMGAMAEYSHYTGVVHRLHVGVVHRLHGGFDHRHFVEMVHRLCMGMVGVVENRSRGKVGHMKQKRRRYMFGRLG